MNFGWLTPDTPDEELRAVVLHEFGHALGFPHHQHQNPQGSSNWNTAALVRDLSGPPNYWDEEFILRNIIGSYSSDVVMGT